jgi:hypothetical protein
MLDVWAVYRVFLARALSVNTAKNKVKSAADSEAICCRTRGFSLASQSRNEGIPWCSDGCWHEALDNGHAHVPARLWVNKTKQKKRLRKRDTFIAGQLFQLYAFCATAVEDVVTNAKAIENSTT